jgi:uncharacterized protein
MSFILFKLFKPNNKVFYKLFEEASINLSVMSNLLNLLVHEADYNKRLVIGRDLIQAEKNNEVLVHHIFVELSKNYVTPFDREDIYGLAKTLEIIGDYLCITGKKINFYKLDPTEVGLQVMVKSVLTSVNAVGEAVLELRNFKKGKIIIDSIIKINETQINVSENFYQCIDALFEEEDDLKEVIKRREVYHILEIISERCKDAGTFLEAIVIKYS